MENDYGIPEVRCDSASNFLYELDETNDRWGNDIWLFRGQNDVGWTLHPRAMRSELITSFVDKYIREFPDRESLPSSVQPLWKDVEDADFRKLLCLKLHTTAEHLLVRSFEELSDRVGLTIPTDRYAILGGDNKPLAFDEIIEKSLTLSVSETNPGRVSYALAQHHGIPTRLMDCTFRPLFAAFFAAHVENELEDEPEYLVVWAIKSKCLRKTGLRVVSHLRSQIGFLQSQDGVFLYDSKANEKFATCGDWQPLERELRSKVLRDCVYKLVLPFRERGNLLALLNSKYVSKPFLMPSFDNVATEIVSESVDWTKLLDGLP